MGWFYPLILITVIFFLLYKYSTRHFNHWKKKNVFYIKPIPFFGNILELFAPKQTLGKNLIDICNAVGDKDFFGMFFFDRPTLIVKSPKLIKDIIQRDFSHFTDRSIASSKKHPVMSNVLFVQRNPLWKEVRSKVSPIFTSGKLKLMFTIMVEETNKMTDYISKFVNIPDIETKEICAKYSTNVLTRCVFAVEDDCFKNDDALFRKIGREMFDFRLKTALRQLGNFFAPGICEFFNITFFDLKIIDMLEGIFTDVLHTRMKSKNLKGNDFVDILLEANRTNGDNGFTREVMLGQLIGFFAPGFETVSSTLSFTLYEFCVNPEIQEKARKEINTYINNDDGITYEAVSKMKYLDNCISETLRKYTPGSFLDRICTADYKIDGTDVVIEKGTPVFIPVDALHFDPKYFPNPEKYDPDRFIDNSNINKNGLFYLPFGEGPRSCIGMRFGLLETKLGVAAILSKYRLEKSEKTPIPIEFEIKSLVLQSTVGIPLKFVPL